MNLSEMKRRRHDLVVPGFPDPIRVEFTFRGIEFLQDVVAGDSIIKALTDETASNTQKMRVNIALAFAGCFDLIAAPGDLIARFDAFKADPRWTPETLGPVIEASLGAFLSFMGIDLKPKVDPTTAAPAAESPTPSTPTTSANG